MKPKVLKLLLEAGYGTKGFRAHCDGIWYWTLMTITLKTYKREVETLTSLCQLVVLCLLGASKPLHIK